MPVNKDAHGRRSIELQFELPGTPEQVWHAIATGPGFSSWFVPSEIEEREGGAVVFHLGPGMDSTGKVTGWEPFRRFAIEEPGWSGEAPPLATEFIIESRGGNSCTLRLVHSLFTTSDQWDNEIDSMETGWPAFFEVLRIYLAHFAGQPSVSIRPTAAHPGPEPVAWESLTKALGLLNATPGERRSAPPDDAPVLAGVVERLDLKSHHHAVTLRMDTPAPGVALIGTYTWAGEVKMALSFYYYCSGAEEIAAREEPRWQAWLETLQSRPPR
jgi:uncharacterized protein YndB with AHSA1/START domain